MDKVYAQYGAQLNDNENLILSVVKNYDKALSYASANLLHDHTFILKVMAINGASLYYATADQKNDEGIVLTAVSENGKSLKYASEALKNNENIVLAAVSNYGNALKYASEKMRLNRNIVLAAAKKRCSVQYIPLAFLNNDEEIISIILDRPSETKYSLNLGNETIRNNREIVMKAVRKNGLNLAFANPILQNDMELVKVAANEHFLALSYTQLNIFDLKDIIFEIFKGYKFRWYYKVHNSTLNNSKYSLLAAIYFNVHNWHKADDTYKNDKELMLFAISINSKSYDYATEQLKQDRDIVIAAINHDDYNHFIIHKYLPLFCKWFKKDEEVLGKIASKTGDELMILKNYEQYLNASTIMEKWFCELPSSTMNELSKCKSLYYPGAYHDFSTIQFFMENSCVTDFYYSDYMNKEISQFSIFDALQSWFDKWDGYQITQHINMHPSYFHEDDWDAFWHPSPNARFGSEIGLSFITKYVIEKDDQIWNIYYFGTEGIATYEVLLKNNIKIDIVVTQDHGLGGCWTSFCEDSLLKKIAKKYLLLPKMILSGGESWSNYEGVSDWFGKFGMHEGKRKLFKKI